MKCCRQKLPSCPWQVTVALLGMAGRVLGLATRAAAESEPHAMYAGLSPRRLSLVNSLLASVIAGAFGILVAPLITLNTTTLPFEIVPALGAALFAGFSSLGVACFAGLLMGAGASLLNYWASQSWFPQSQGNPINGLAELLFFVLVAIAMAWRGSKIPARGELTEKRMPLAPAIAAGGAGGRIIDGEDPGVLGGGYRAGRAAGRVAAVAPL